MCILVVLLCRWFLWLMGLLEGAGGIWPPFLTSKKIPRTHEEGLSNSSCASHGAKQEDVVKNSGCRASKIPGKSSTFGCREGKIPGKSSTFGCREGKIPEKKQHFWVQRAHQHFWVQRGQRERAKSPVSRANPPPYPGTPLLRTPFVRLWDT